MALLPEGFVREVCRSASGLRLLFMFSVAVFGLMLLWVPFVDTDSATGVVVTINLVAAGAFAVISGYFVRRCQRFEAEIREEYDQYEPDDPPRPP